MFVLVSKFNGMLSKFIIICKYGFIFVGIILIKFVVIVLSILVLFSIFKNIFVVIIIVVIINVFGVCVFNCFICLFIDLKLIISVNEIFIMNVNLGGVIFINIVRIIVKVKVVFIYFIYGFVCVCFFIGNFIFWSCLYILINLCIFIFCVCGNLFFFIVFLICFCFLNLRYIVNNIIRMNFIIWIGINLYYNLLIFLVFNIVVICVIGFF